MCFASREHYTIPGFSADADEKDAPTRTPRRIVRVEIPKPRTEVRTADGVDSPRHVVQRITIELPETWTVKAEESVPPRRRFPCVRGSVLRRRPSASSTSIDPARRRFRQAICRGTTPMRWASRTAWAPGLPGGRRARAWPKGHPTVAARCSWRFLRSCLSPAPSASTAGPSVPRASRCGGRGRRAAAFRLRAGVQRPGRLAGADRHRAVLHTLASVLTLSRVMPLFSAGSWHELTNPAGSQYNILWAPALLFEAANAVGTGLASILLIVLSSSAAAPFPPCTSGCGLRPPRPW